ncbi:hypothetical protein HDU96_001766 [Phlyctochytrium bullatum]|nr:hypothetical protein HDU96_001766 [Phlyctochytrium bullatum]
MYGSVLPTTNTSPTSKRPSIPWPTKTSYASAIPAFFASRLKALIVALVFALLVLQQLTALTLRHSSPIPGDESSTSPAAVAAAASLPPSHTTHDDISSNSPAEVVASHTSDHKSSNSSAEVVAPHTPSHAPTSDDKSSHSHTPSHVHTPHDEAPSSSPVVVASPTPAAHEVAHADAPATHVNASSDLPEGLDPAFRDFFNLMEANGFVNSRKFPVMVQVNQGFLHLAENLACTAVNASMDKSLMVYWSMDPATHQYLTSKGYLSYYNPERFTTHHGAENYHSENYNKMMRDRITFWQTLANMGVSFFWVDADIAIHKDIRYLIDRPAYADLDAVFQPDTGHLPIFQEYAMGRYLPRPNTEYIEACGGFFFLRATPRTKTFLGRVKEFMDKDPKIEDQQALNLVLKNRQKASYLAPFEGWDPREDVHPEHKLVWTYLSHQEVPGGRLLPHTRPELRYVSHLNSLGNTRSKTQYLMDRGWWNCPHLQDVLQKEDEAKRKEEEAKQKEEVNA